MMAPIVAGMDADTIREVADYYASLSPPAGFAGGALALRGANIAARGIPEQRVPPCAECHGPKTTDVNPAYPRLSGQFAAYLSLQLQLFAKNRRGGSPYAHIMRKVAGQLTADQMKEVAAHYASLSAGEPLTGSLRDQALSAGSLRLPRPE